MQGLVSVPQPPMLGRTQARKSTVVGVLMYDKVLGTEVTAPLDVFAKHTEDGRQLFNVLTLAQSYEPVVSEEGLWMLPDRTFADAPELDVIVVPSAYDMGELVKNQAIVRFVREQNEHTDYTMSNCAGAQLIGEAVGAVADRTDAELL